MSKRCTKCDYPYLEIEDFMHHLKFCDYSSKGIIKA